MCRGCYVYPKWTSFMFKTWRYEYENENEKFHSHTFKVVYLCPCLWVNSGDLRERVAKIVWSLYGPVPQFWLIVSGWRKLIKCGFVWWVYLMSFKCPSFLWFVWFVESLAKWSEPLARHRLFLAAPIQTSICESPKFVSNDDDEDEEYTAGRSRKVKMGGTHSVLSSWS